VDRIEHYFISAWIFAAPIVAFFLGGIYTRWVCTDRYCPRCKAYREWNEDLKREAKKIHSEKKP
jgi:hypothetical protein